MSQTERNQRLRLLLRRLNKQRKQQASQIDILCNDLIGAHRSFLQRLQEIGFAAEFYRSLLGGTDANGILTRAGRVIRQELPGAGVSFFLRQSDGFELHACPGDESLYSDHPGPQDDFDSELVDSICKHNKPCTFDDIVAMSTGSTLAALRKYSLATLPVSDLGRSLGFVLLYCPLPQALNAADVRRVGPVMCGLAQALRGVPAPALATLRAGQGQEEKRKARGNRVSSRAPGTLQLLPFDLFLLTFLTGVRTIAVITNHAQQRICLRFCSR